MGIFFGETRGVRLSNKSDSRNIVFQISEEYGDGWKPIAIQALRTANIDDFVLEHLCDMSTTYDHFSQDHREWQRCARESLEPLITELSA